MAKTRAAVAACAWFLAAQASLAWAAPGAAVPPPPANAVDPDEPNEQQCLSPEKISEDLGDSAQMAALEAVALTKQRCAMSVAYRRARATLATKPEALAKLDRAQERWRAYRDALLLERFPRIEDDGNYYGTVVSSCFIADRAFQTRERTTELAKLTTCRAAAPAPAAALAKLKLAEDQLAVVLSAVQAAYPKEAMLLKALKNGQKQWQALRDAQLDFVATLSGNPQSRCAQAERERLTRMRTGYLSAWLATHDEFDMCTGSWGDGRNVSLADQTALVAERSKVVAEARLAAKATRTSIARLGVRERAAVRQLSAVDAQFARQEQRAAAARAQLESALAANQAAVAKRAAATEIAAYKAIASRAAVLEKQVAAWRTVRSDLEGALGKLTELTSSAKSAAAAAEAAARLVRGWPKAPTADASAKAAALTEAELQSAHKLLGLDAAAYRAQTAAQAQTMTARLQVVARAQARLGELTGTPAEVKVDDAPLAQAPTISADPKLPKAKPQQCDVRHLDWLNMEYPWPSRVNIALKEGKSRAAYGKGQLDVALERLHFGKLKGAKGAVAFARLRAIYEEGGKRDVRQLSYVFEDMQSPSYLTSPECRIVLSALIEDGVGDERITDAGVEYVNARGAKQEWRRSDAEPERRSPGQWHLRNLFEHGCDLSKVDWCKLDAKGKKVARKATYSRDGERFELYCLVAHQGDRNLNWRSDVWVEIGEEMLKPDDMDDDDWASYFGTQGSPFAVTETFCLELDAKCRPTACTLGPRPQFSSSASGTARPGVRLRLDEIRNAQPAKVTLMAPVEVLRRWGAWADPYIGEDPRYRESDLIYRPSEGTADFLAAVDAVYPDFDPMEITGPGRQPVYGRLPDGREVFVVAACMPHDCGDNQYAIVYEIEKRRASLIRSVIDETKGYGNGGYALYGQPDALVRATLLWLTREEHLRPD